MEVSWNRGTPKSSIFWLGCSLINHPLLGPPIYGNLQCHFQMIGWTLLEYHSPKNKKLRTWGFFVLHQQLLAAHTLKQTPQLIPNVDSRAVGRCVQHPFRSPPKIYGYIYHRCPHSDSNFTGFTQRKTWLQNWIQSDLVENPGMIMDDHGMFTMADLLVLWISQLSTVVPYIPHKALVSASEDQG